MTTDLDTGAFKILKDFFTGLGIQFSVEIENIIRAAMEEGYGPDQIDLFMPDLQQTQAFKARFPGFEQRISNGYNAISIAEYLQVENTYHRILQESGLPAGFYDDPSDFANWISNNVSPQEIQTRVTMATTAAQQIDPTMRRLLGEFYGLATGDIAAYFLDQDRALPVIQRQYTAAGIASQAARAGLAVNGMSRFESLADSGLTVEQAAQGYGTVAALSDTVGRAASIYGESYTTEDAEQDVFFNKSDKRRRIMSQEASTFSGTSSGATGTANRQSY